MDSKKMTDGEIAVLPEKNGNVGLLIVANGGLTEEKDHGLVRFGREGLSFEKMPGLSDFAAIDNNGIVPQELDDARFMKFQRLMGNEPLVHAFAFPTSSEEGFQDTTAMYTRVPQSVADSLGMEVNRLYPFDDVGVRLKDGMKLHDTLANKTLEDIITSVGMQSEGKTPVAPEPSVASRPGDLEAPPAQIVLEEDDTGPSGP